MVTTIDRPKVTDLGKYERRVARLEEKRNALMRAGRYMQMMELNAEIEKVKDLIEKEKEFQPRPAHELITGPERNELVTLLLECHMAADFLNAVTYAVHDWLKERNLQAFTVVPEITDIIKKTESFGAALCKISPRMSDLITDNHTLIEALHKKTQNYLVQRVKRGGKTKK